MVACSTLVVEIRLQAMLMRAAQPVGVLVLGLVIVFGAEQGSYDAIQDAVRQSVACHRVVSGTSSQVMARGAPTVRIRRR